MALEIRPVALEDCDSIIQLFGRVVLIGNYSKSVGFHVHVIAGLPDWCPNFGQLH